MINSVSASSLPSLQYLSERISQSWDNKASAIKVSNGTHVYLNTKRVLEYDVRKELADR